MTAVLSTPLWTRTRSTDSCEVVIELEPEARLFADIRAGKPEAWEELVRQYGGRMLAVARRLLHSLDDSADAVQEAFLYFLRSLDSFEGKSRLWTWLYRILTNVCLGKLRARTRRRTVSIEDLLPTFDDAGRHVNPVPRWQEPSDDPLSRAELQAQIRAGIKRLPEPYRTVLMLRDIQELDTDQTARLLCLSRPAVKTRLHRARQALRTLLEPSLSDARGA